MSQDNRGKGDDGKLLYCSFCGKSQHEVRKLIAGPTVYICNECVEVCLDIIAEDRVQEAKSRQKVLPKPNEIKDQLDEYVIGQEQAKKNIEQEFQNAKEELKAEMADQAVALAEALIKKNINDDDQKVIIDEYLTKVVVAQ